MTRSQRKTRAEQGFMISCEEESRRLNLASPSPGFLTENCNLASVPVPGLTSHMSHAPVPGPTLPSDRLCFATVSGD